MQPSTITRLLSARPRVMYDVEGACQILGCAEDAVASVWVAGEPQATTKRLCETHHQRILAILGARSR